MTIPGVYIWADGFKLNYFLQIVFSKVKAQSKAEK